MDLNISLATKILKKTRPWHIFLSKRNALRKETDETKYVSLLTKDPELLVQYNNTQKLQIVPKNNLTVNLYSMTNTWKLN